MPWEHYGFIGQGKQFIVYAFNKCVVVAARQIGTANTALKQHIAAYYVSGFFVVKHHVAGRMARAKKHL